MRKASRQASPGKPELSTYLVEQYCPGIKVEGFHSAAERLRTAAGKMARTGALVRYVRSTIVPADEAAYSVFNAASVELVEQVYTRAGVPFDRIVGALEARPQRRSKVARGSPRKAPNHRDG